MQIVITLEGNAYTQVDSVVDCGSNSPIGCECHTRTLCDTSLCSGGTRGLEKIIGYPVKWKYLGDVPWKAIKIFVFYEGHMYTAHVISSARVCCDDCDAYRKPFCTKYSSGKNRGALCALLETVLKGGDVVFKEVT